MKQFPKVNLVVLNYNGKKELTACLSSLFCLDYPNFEVVLVDNASMDGSLELAKKNFAKATFIRNERNLGFAAGSNVGIRYSLEKMADYVLLVNNDTVWERECLTNLMRVAVADAKSGLFSPLIFSGNGERVWFSGGKIDWMRMKTMHARELLVHDNKITDFVSGCALLVKKDVFSRVGLLDEDYFLYWEDVDFSVRARRAGFTGRIVADARIRHLEKSEGNPENKIYWLVFSGLLFFQKNDTPLFRFWHGLYLFLRKAKNRLERKKYPQKKIAFVVEKAYKDFKKYVSKSAFHHHR